MLPQTAGLDPGLIRANKKLNIPERRWRDIDEPLVQPRQPLDLGFDHGHGLLRQPHARVIDRSDQRSNGMEAIPGHTGYKLQHRP